MLKRDYVLIYITVATAALKRKKMNEMELNRLGESRLHLEMQVNTLEAANMNAETMAAMKKAADALKVIHGNLWVFPPLSVSITFILLLKNNRTMDKVDATMAAVNEQRELANEIADTIATPLYTTEIDDVCSSRLLLVIH